MRRVAALHIPPAMGEAASASTQVVREFVMSQGQLRRMDAIVADPDTRTAPHPYFPGQPIFVAKYKGLSTAHPFALRYDDSRMIVAARTIPRGHPTPIHPVMAAPGSPPIAYVFGGSLQHLAVDQLTGLALHVPVARSGEIYRITAGETAEGQPRFHRVLRHTGRQRVAVELEKGMLSRGWRLGDVADLVRRVTDLGLGLETRIARYVQSAIRAPRGSCETEDNQVSRIKRELLE